jgi:hypothetical protein
VKRPRSLGGPGDGKPDGDDDRSGSDGDERPKATAPSGSSEAARRRLADRVGRPAESDEPAAKQKPDRSGKPDSPEAAAPEKPAKPRKEKPEKPKEKPEKPDGRAGAAKASEPKRDEPDQRAGAAKLHRPRRQPESGPKRRPESPKERTGSKAKAEPKSKAKPDSKPKERKPASGRKRGEPEGRKRRAEAAKRKRRGTGKRAGARAKAGAATFATALKQGATATRKSAAENAPKAGRALIAVLAAAFALFFAALGFVITLLIAAGRVVAGPVRAVLRFLDRATRAASRVVTPARALAVVVAGAAVLLALSQYADYRSVSIGNDAYSGVQTVAPAPETGRLQTGDAHSYVFVPVAIACLLLLAVAMVGRRWQACRLIALAGIAAVAVALLVDRPAGLDPGDAAVAFDGVRATLIGGFYAQIAAGILLIGSSTLLGRELRPAAAPERAEARARKRGPTPKRGRRGRAAGPGTGPEGTARA